MALLARPTQAGSGGSEAAGDIGVKLATKVDRAETQSVEKKMLKKKGGVAGQASFGTGLGGTEATGVASC